MKWLITIILLFLPVSALFTLDEEYIMGKTDNWKDILYLNNILAAEGKWGFLDLVLQDSENQLSGTTDLLIHFNQAPLAEESRNYTITGSAPVLSGTTRFLGEASCAFQGKKDRKELIPGAGALFKPGTLWGDFSIEFRIYPATLSNGETILSWNGSQDVNAARMLQSFNCTIQNRKITWSFINFFLSATGNAANFTLEELTPMLPRKWYHHLIRFDGNTGLLEYLVNGVSEAILYTTDNARQGSTVNLPMTGNRSTGNLVLGNDFTGFIDELHISRAFIADPLVYKYANPAGSVVSRIIDFGYTGTIIKRIDAVYNQPGNSEIYFFYKTDDELYRRDALKPDWIQFLPGTDLDKNIKGEYFQFMIEFHADGARSLSPALSALTIVYEPDLPPLPPPDLMAVPKDRSVLLQWKTVNEYDIAGYLVYYGEYPGAYNGIDASEGESPVDAGSTNRLLLTGLQNGKIYYFTVVAYDSARLRHKSVFSKEVSARPSVLYK